MPFHAATMGETVDRTEGLGAIRIKQGRYRLQFNGGDPTSEDYGGDMAIWHRLVILDGPDAVGRTFPHMTSVEDKSAWKLGQTVAAVGMKPEGLKQLQWNSYAEFATVVGALVNALKGRTFWALIGDNEYNGKVTSQIMEFYREGPDGMPILPSGSPVTPATPVTQPTTAAAPAEPAAAPAPVAPPAPAAAADINAALTNLFGAQS